jgi:hypothetical protein
VQEACSKPKAALKKDKLSSVAERHLYPGTWGISLGKKQSPHQTRSKRMIITNEGQKTTVALIVY